VDIERNERDGKQGYTIVARKTGRRGQVMRCARPIARTPPSHPKTRCSGGVGAQVVSPRFLASTRATRAESYIGARLIQSRLKATAISKSARRRLATSALSNRNFLKQTHLSPSPTHQKPLFPCFLRRYPRPGLTLPKGHPTLTQSCCHLQFALQRYPVTSFLLRARASLFTCIRRTSRPNSYALTI